MEECECPFCKKTVNSEETEGEKLKELLAQGLPTIKILPHAGVSEACKKGFYPAVLAAW